MGIMQHPAALPPAPAVMAILDRFNRDELGNTIEVLIALLDCWDGDPDAETGNDVEDDFVLTADALHSDQGPGCAVSDLPERDDEPEEDDDAGQSTEDEISFGNRNFGRRGPGCVISDSDFDQVDVEGDMTTLEEFRQGCGSAPYDHEDDEPRRVAPEWPAPAANA